MVVTRSALRHVVDLDAFPNLDLTVAAFIVKVVWVTATCQCVTVRENGLECSVAGR
jgi:hypothetical protein